MANLSGAPAVKLTKSVRETVGEEEWHVRVDLAAAYRLTAHFGMTELIANHISVRVPNTEDQFLLNPHGLMYDEMRASDFIRVDHEGNELYNPTEDFGVGRAGFVIHSAIHMGRPDIACIQHTHTPAGMAISALECGLVPLAQPHMRFLNVAYHEFEGHAVELGERERLVRDLGDSNCMILRNHGLLACGTNVPNTWRMMFHMERACQTQLMAMACNTPLHHAPVEQARKSQEIIAARDGLKREPGNRNVHGSVRLWDALLRMLDRTDPSYKE